MTIKMLCSTAADATAATQEVIAQAGGIQASFVLWFASPKLDAAIVANALSAQFSEAACMGCSTSGELTSGKMLKGALVAMAADRSSISEAHVSLISDVQSDEATGAALAALAKGMGVADPAAMDPQAFVGLVLQDGMSGAEESVMARLSGATNLPFVGGSAGDDLAFERTNVYVGAEGGSGRAALASIKPAGGYRILKTQSFRVLDQVLEVTECEPETRTIVSFNDKPAADAYAEALGVSVSKLADEFGTHPLGLVVEGGEPFVRSPREIQDGKVAFYCQVLPGMKLHVLEATEIVEQTKADLAEALSELGSCSGVINFHCILRTLELEARGACEAYGKVFADVPMVGFSTYGESYVGHINQTSTMVLLG